MLKFRKKRRHETGNLKTDLFLVHLQPPLEKNSEDLAILILEFDDVTVKKPSIVFFHPSRRSSWGSSLGSTFCTVPVQDVLKCPFYSTHELSLNYRLHN